MAPQPETSIEDLFGQDGATIDKINDLMADMSPEQLSQIAPFIEMMALLDNNTIRSYPPRLAKDPLFAAQYGAKPGDTYYYTGPGIVDADGMILIERQFDPSNPDQPGEPVKDPISGEYTFVQYDPRANATQKYFELQQNNPDSLDALLSFLARKGYKTGTMTENIAAIQKLYQAGRDNGVSFETVVQNMQMYQPDAEPDETELTVARLTSPTDLADIANRTAKSAIGRELSLEERQRFVTAYQQSEQKYYNQINDPTAMSITDRPSADTAAQSFISQRMPDEEVAYTGLTNIGWLVDSLKGIV